MLPANASCAATRLFEHPMIGCEMTLLAQPDGAQGSSYRASSRRKQCAGDQYLHVLKGRASEGNRKKPRGVRRCLQCQRGQAP